MGVVTVELPKPDALPPFFSAGLRDLRFPLRDLREPPAMTLSSRQWLKSKSING